jgi:uncharacterized protein
VRFACHGGCLKERFVTTPDGEPGLNYLCPGHKALTRHVDAPMKRIRELLREDRAPRRASPNTARTDVGGPPAPRKYSDPCSISMTTARVCYRVVNSSRRAGAAHGL